MSANDIPFPIPADFKERSRQTDARIAGGEQMTLEQVAAALGVPAEFVAAAAAVYAALMSGKPVVVGPVTGPASNLKLN